MIKTALTTALIIGSISAAFATSFDPNMENRYPQAGATQVFEGRNVSLTAPAVVERAMTVDRAGNPYAGGGF